MPIYRRRTRWHNWRMDQGFSQLFTINKNSLQANGLVFWIPGFVNTGTRHDDVIGGLNLAEVNSPVWVNDSERGWVLQFDTGSSQALNVGATPVTAVGLTMSAWIRRSDITIAGAIVSIADQSLTRTYFGIEVEGIGGGTNAKMLVATQAANITLDSTTAANVNGQWYHVTGVAVSSTERHIYLDGGGKGTNVTDITPTGLDRIRIGSRGDLNPSDFFSGEIVDVRIYNRALSDFEVAELYNPQTRWDLYQPIRSAFFQVSPEVVAVRIPRIPATYNTLQIY